MVSDVNGLALGKGDVVAPLTGDFKGKVCAVKSEDGEGFVSIRAAHRPYSKGVWYASEHVQRLQVAKPRPEKAKPESTPSAKNGKTKAGSGR